MNALTCTTTEELTEALATISQGTVALQVPPRGGAEIAILNKLNTACRAGQRALLVCVDTTQACNYRAALESLASLAPNNSAASTSSAGNASSAASTTSATNTLSASNIVTVSDLALSLLKDPAVQKACGRGGRLLDGNESDVLLEDVKVTGIKPRRLREMLKFFYNSMANCTQDEPNWIISEEEQRVYSVLMENLEQRGAVHSCELSAMAYKGAAAAPEGIESFGAAAVVAAGFDQMSKTSQRLVRALATKLFIATGTGAGVASVDEPYPNACGFTELAQEEGTQHIALTCTATSIPVTIRTGKTPAEEFEIITQNVAQLLQQGAKATDLVIGTPNKVWSEKIASCLKGLGVATVVEGKSTKLKGDPRDIKAAGSIAARAFFRLQLNPQDVTALRTWVGIGDWLLCSEPFLEILAWAKQNNMRALEALRFLHANAQAAASMVMFHKIDARMSVLDELNETYASGKVSEIVAAFQAHGIQMNAAAEKVLLNCEDVASESDLRRVARAGVGSVPDLDNAPEAVDAGLSDSAGAGNAGADDARAGEAGINKEGSNAVTIAPYAHCIGHHAKHLLLTGMVNGFLPSLRAVDDKYTIDERAKAREHETKFFDYLKAIPTESLEISLFEQDLLENAGKLKMSTTRIFVQEGQQRALVAPSLFVEEITKAHQSAKERKSN